MIDSHPMCICNPYAEPGPVERAPNCRACNPSTPADPRDVRLEHALRELHAIVCGECPSLLNEDSGGSAWLALEIEDLLTPKPDAPPNPAAEPEPINYHRAVEHLSGRIEDLEGALRKANDRLAAIHRAHQDGVHPSVNRLVDSLPTLIEEGEKALREEEKPC